jgi:hypothetical protein
MLNDYIRLKEGHSLWLFDTFDMAANENEDLVVRAISERSAREIALKVLRNHQILSVTRIY